MFTLTEKPLPEKGTHIVSFDVLRVVAAFAVVFLHIAAQKIFTAYPSKQWEIMNFYDSSVRWCVPIFVMISGALFLNSNRNLDIKKLYTKNIWRMVRTFFIWSLLYSIVYHHNSLKPFVENLVQGEFHLWFLKMLIGLYIAIPILKVIVQNKKIEIYFLCLSFITAYIIPLTIKMLRFYDYELMFFAEKNINTVSLNIAMGYSGYFVLGHFLTHYDLSVKLKRIIYLLGALSFVAVVLGTSFIAHVFTGKPTEDLYGNLIPLTLFEASAIFIFITDKFPNNIKLPKLISDISNVSFGIYLVHIFFIRIFGKFGITCNTFHPLFFIPCLSVAIFVCSYVTAKIISLIPYLKKWMM